MAESTRTTVGFVRQSSLVIGKAQALQITSRDTYQKAATMLSGLTALGREVDAHHDPIIKAAMATVNEARGAKALYKKPIEAAIGIIKGKSVDWDTEQRNLAEKERRRLQVIEDQRVVDERAANEKIEKDLRKVGNVEAAEQVKAIPVKAETIQAAAPREIPGQKFKPIYGIEITDLRALVKAWLDGKVDGGAIQANEVLLGQMARNEQSRKEVKTYPGVNVWEKKILASI